MPITEDQTQLHTLLAAAISLLEAFEPAEW
jgi:hypothetical protein